MLQFAVVMGPHSHAIADVVSLPYSGRFVKDDASPVQGPIDILVEFFATENGTESVSGPHLYNDVNLEDGVFQLNISLESREFHKILPSTSQSAWIQVTDATNGMTYPRQILAAIPYALKVPVDGSSIGWNDDGELEIRNQASVTRIDGNTIQAANPQAGQVLSWDAASSSWKAITITDASLTNNSITGTKIADGTIGFDDLDPSVCNAGEIMKINGSGDGWDCDVLNAGSGDVINGGNAGVVTIGSNDSTLTLEANNNPSVTILATGNVGIGTVTPTAKLAIDSQLSDTSSSTYYGNYTNLLRDGVTTGTDFAYGSYINANRTSATGGNPYLTGQGILVTGSGPLDTLTGTFIDVLGDANKLHGVYTNIQPGDIGGESIGQYNNVFRAGGTGPGGFNAGNYNYVGNNANFSSQNQMYGTYNQVDKNNNASADSEVYGTYNIVYNSGGTQTNDTYGSYNEVTGEPDGTSTAYGVWSQADGADTNYLFYGAAAAAAGTSLYGIYIDVNSGAGNEYAGAFLNGNVGIGTATPATELDVAGTIRAEQICDEGGGSCKDISTGWSGGGQVVQIQTASDATYATAAGTAFPRDDTIPQNTEGYEVITVSITPTDTSSTLFIQGSAQVMESGNPTSNHIFCALFQDSTADALGMWGGGQQYGALQTPTGVNILHTMAAGTTSSTTFKIRCGVSEVSGAIEVNGNTSGRLYGGTLRSVITVTELAP